MRAGMLRRAGDYRWSNATAHLTGEDANGVLDLEWWRREARTDWNQALNAAEWDLASAHRQCTYSGRPFGNESFVNEMAERFGRRWIRGRPKKEEASAGPASKPTYQLGLF